MPDKPVQIPFQEVTACEKCGNPNLSKVHNQKYADKEGIVQFVIYRCPSGHETQRRQLVVKGTVKGDPDFWRN